MGAGGSICSLRGDVSSVDIIVVRRPLLFLYIGDKWLNSPANADACHGRQSTYIHTLHIHSVRAPVARSFVQQLHFIVHRAVARSPFVECSDLVAIFCRHTLCRSFNQGRMILQLCPRGDRGALPVESHEPISSPVSHLGYNGST